MVCATLQNSYQAKQSILYVAINDGSQLRKQTNMPTVTI